MSLKNQIDAFKEMGNILCNNKSGIKPPPEGYALMYNTFANEKTFFWVHLSGDHGGYSDDKVKTYQNMILDSCSRSAKISYNFMKGMG